MTGKVIQGWFLTGQPKWSSSVQPKTAPSSFPAKIVPPPPTAFASHPSAPASGGRQGTVQRHGAGGAFGVEAEPLGLVSSGGRPIPDAVRGKMEAALGADFSNVRVHVGPQAERIGAIAFTVGSDIYFAPGRYQPETIQGQQLLGHELAHVVQQRAGRVRNPLGSGLAVVQDRALEAEADRLGQRAAAHPVAAQAKLAPRAAQPSAPVRISPPVSAGSGTYRLSAGAGGHEIGSVMVQRARSAHFTAGLVQRMQQERPTRQRAASFGNRLPAAQLDWKNNSKAGSHLPGLNIKIGGEGEMFAKGRVGGSYQGTDFLVDGEFETGLHAEMAVLQNACNAGYQLHNVMEILIGKEPCHRCAVFLNKLGLSGRTYYKNEGQKEYYTWGFPNLSGWGLTSAGILGLDAPDAPSTQELLKEFAQTRWWR